jgi:hypothetical protein
MRHGQSRASVRYTEIQVRLPQHADQLRPERPVLLAVDEELGEGAALPVAPELSDPVGPVEVGEHEDVEQLGARSRPKGHRDLPEVGAPARRVSLPEATVEPSPGFRRACPYAFANTGAT